MKTLSGVDGAFLHLETKDTPMHVASLHLFDLPAGYTGDFHADIKGQMRRRLHLARVFPDPSARAWHRPGQRASGGILSAPCLCHLQP